MHFTIAVSLISLSASLASARPTAEPLPPFLAALLGQTSATTSATPSATPTPTTIHSPTSTPTSTPTSSSSTQATSSHNPANSIVPASNSPEAAARQQNHNQVSCKAYRDAGHTNESVAPCGAFCGNLVDTANGNIHSVLCFSETPIGQPIQYYNDNVGKYQMGVCRCNPPLADMIINEVAMALPAIAEIGCEIMVKSFELIAEVGSLAIPGAGELEAADAGTQALVKGAQIIKKGGKKADSMLDWLHPCGNDKFTQGIDGVFGNATLGMI